MVGSVIKYQQYTEYKNSGVEWLEEVPQHWALVPCRAVVDHIVEKNSNNALDNYLSLMANIGVIRYEDKGDIGNKKPDDLSKCKIVRRGQLVINSMNYAIGSYGMSPYDGICSPVYIVLQTKKDIFLERFALRIFENTPFQKYLATFGNGILEHRAAINWEDIKNKYVPLPTLDEQKNILDFLDHETSKIDSLIEKQQQLIELLKEKRQAVISHAVTKGLNPDVAMKDSGVEWLGEVPEHWTVSLIKYQCKEITDGAHISPDLENGEHFFVSIRDIKEGIINFDEALLTSDKSYQYLVHTGCKPFAGDILFSKDGTIGQTAITPSDIDFVVASSLIIIRPKCSKVTSEFLDLLLRSDIVQEQVESFVKGAALRRLSIQNLLKIWGVFPPIDEQEKIVEFVLFQLDKYKDLEFKAEKQVELLKKRRTALISAAVTGKIDVRNWQNPNNNNEAKTEFSA